MEKENVKRVTRESLRALQDGESITVQCANGYELESQRNTAYAMQKLEGCGFRCKTDGLLLTVERYGIE